MNPLPILQPMPLFTAAWSDVMQLRHHQVEWFGHDAAADDRIGPFVLFGKAKDDLNCVRSMLHGDPRKLCDQDQLVLRRRAIRGLALGFAAVDTFDRAMAVGK